ncbi:MAG: hypothetical protein ACAF41_15245 [Leptolyngbya sp. BL-A-14]
MPKVRCTCGESIALHAIPHPQTFALVWEPDVETLMDELLLIHREATSEDEFYKQAAAAFYRQSHTRRNPEVIECSECGRLIVFAKPGDRSSIMTYVPDADRWEETYSLRALMEGRHLSTQAATDTTPSEER